LGKARAGQLDLNLVLADDTQERRELVRAIDMVRKRVQRSKRHQPLDDQLTPGPDLDQRNRTRQELGEILEAARQAVLSPRQDRIVELWTRGWTVPEIGEALKMPVARVSDEKYKALRKLEHHLAGRRDELDLGLPPWQFGLTRTPGLSFCRRFFHFQFESRAPPDAFASAQVHASSADDCHRDCGI
jgi:hypothetical protein